MCRRLPRFTKATIYLQHSHLTDGFLALSIDMVVVDIVDKYTNRQPYYSCENVIHIIIIWIHEMLPYICMRAHESGTKKKRRQITRIYQQWLKQLTIGLAVYFSWSHRLYSNEKLFFYITQQKFIPIRTWHTRWSFVRYFSQFVHFTFDTKKTSEFGVTNALKVCVFRWNIKINVYHLNGLDRSVWRFFFLSFWGFLFHFVQMMRLTWENQTREQIPFNKFGADVSLICSKPQKGQILVPWKVSGMENKS